MSREIFQVILGQKLAATQRRALLRGGSLAHEALDRGRQIGAQLVKQLAASPFR
jgi:hypothetical protein